MKVNIIKAAMGDIQELNKVSLAAKMHWNYPPEWLEKWKDDLTLTQKDFSEQTIFKLTDEFESIIGFCSIKEHDSEYEVTHLWIQPAYIGKGYGKYLLTESIRKVVLKEKPIIVEADPNAEGFYLNQGFKPFKKKAGYPKGRLLPLMKRESQSDKSTSVPSAIL